MEHGAGGSYLDEITNNLGGPVDEQTEPVAVRAWREHNGDLRLHGGVLTCPPPSCIEPENHIVRSIIGPDDIRGQRNHVRPTLARRGQEIPEPPARNLITKFVQRHPLAHLEATSSSKRSRSGAGAGRPTGPDAINSVARATTSGRAITTSAGVAQLMISPNDRAMSGSDDA